MANGIPPMETAILKHHNAVLNAKSRRLQTNSMAKSHDVDCQHPICAGICKKRIEIIVQPEERSAGGWKKTNGQWRCPDSKCQDWRRACETCKQLKNPNEYQDKRSASCKACTRPSCANVQCVSGKDGKRYGDKDHCRGLYRNSAGWIDQKWYCPGCRFSIRQMLMKNLQSMTQ